MSSRESAIEKQVCAYAEEKGGIAIKLAPMSSAGWPDKMLFFQHPRHAIIEFKAKGEKPRKLQIHRMNQLIMLGWKVYLIDTVEGGKSVIDAITAP